MWRSSWTRCSSKLAVGIPLASRNLPLPVETLAPSMKENDSPFIAGLVINASVINARFGPDNTLDILSNLSMKFTISISPTFKNRYLLLNYCTYHPEFVLHMVPSGQHLSLLRIPAFSIPIRWLNWSGVTSSWFPWCKTSRRTSNPSRQPRKNASGKSGMPVSSYWGYEDSSMRRNYATLGDKNALSRSNNGALKLPKISSFSSCGPGV